MTSTLALAFANIQAKYDSAKAGEKYKVAKPIKKSTQLALWICLSTMSRIGETLMAEWKHVNFGNRTWFIPKENVKGKRSSLTVALSDFALRQFQALHLEAGNGRWVFGARDDEVHVDLKSVTKQVADRQEMFMKHSKPLQRRRADNSLVLGGSASGKWTPHDLRRTGATMMEAMGINPDVIDRCQNHLPPGRTKVRRAYQHHTYDEEMRAAWHALGQRLDSLLAMGRFSKPLA